MRPFIQNILFSLLIALSFTAANAQSAAFTYQGKLTENNNPANGTYQMQFGLYDAASGGDQIGVTQTTAAVPVIDGTFAVELNFGGASFNGSPRFVQVAVFSTATNGFVELNPRQQITSAPYSVKSLTAENALNLGGTPANQFVVTNDPRMSDARPPTAGSNLYIQAGAHNPGADISIGGAVTANGYDSNSGYSIGGSSVLRASGTENLFVGLGSGLANSTGASNTMVGYSSGIATSTGTANSFFGRNAGAANVTGSANTMIGSGANLGASNLTFATAIGANSVVSTINTIVLGRAAGQDTVQVPGVLNVANQYNLGGARVLSIAGSENVFVGQNAGVGNTTGSLNAFFGRAAGFANTIGSENSFFGRSAGFSNTTGTGNSFFGRSTGLANTIGTFNSFFGALTGDSNTTGNNNTFVGAAAGSANTSGKANTFLGLQAGEGSTTGDDNVFIGANAGNTNTTGTSNTYVGYNAKGNAGITNATAIGAHAFVNQSNQIMIGTDSNIVLIPGAASLSSLRLNTLASSGIVQICRNALFDLATCSSSLRYKTNIAGYNSGMGIVNRLRPITFDWREGGMHDLGLGAEDVAAVEPLLVHYNKDGQVEGVKYDRVAVVLLNAVREQQGQIQKQQAQMEELKRLVCSLSIAAVACKGDSK